MEKILCGSLAVVLPLGGPICVGEVVIILGVVGMTGGGHEIYSVYGYGMGYGCMIGYSLDVVYRVVED